MLTTDRHTPEAIGEEVVFPMLGSTLILAGALVALDASGWARPGATATGLRAVGRAESRVDNSGGSDGDLSVTVKRGIFRWDNAAGDAITAAHVGGLAWIVDDHTVAATSGSNTRSPAGRVMAVDAMGVWVATGMMTLTSPAGALLAANNLGDVASAPAARAAIEANKAYLRIGVGSLVGTGVYRTVAPRAGTLTSIRSVISGALATGNATLTATIDGVSVTNGALTITQAGSAAGDVDVATPSAANTFTAGQVIALTVGGTNSDANATAEVVLEFTY